MEVNCACCTGGVTPDVLYARILSLGGESGHPECNDPCFELGNICIELHRTGTCTWEGTAPTHVTCYPISTLIVSMTCDGSNVIVQGIWHMGGSSFIRFIRTFAGATLSCTACTIRALSPGFPNPVPGTFCSASGASLELNFQPYGEGCCTHCPDQYEVTLANFQTPQASCDEDTCEDLNGVYLLDFDAANTTPPACGDGLGNWCRYASPSLNLACVPASPNGLGYCRILAYIKTDNNCHTRVIVLLEVDLSPGTFNCASPGYNGWGGNTITQQCKTLDTTFGIGNVCLDTGDVCRLDTGATCRIRAV